jgi:hypothetical protein
MSAAEPLRTPGPRPEVVEPARSSGPRPETEVVLARVRALAQRRIAWLRRIGCLPPAPAALASASELQFALQDLDSPEAEQEWQHSEPALFELNRTIERDTALLRATTDSPLGRLSSAFGLSAPERDVLEVCLALELDPSLGPVYALLQRHSACGFATEVLVTRLAGHPRGPLLGAGSHLVRWQLVQTAEAAPGDLAPLRLDPQIVDFACGRSSLDPVLFDAFSIVSPERPLSKWPVAALAERIDRALSQGEAIRLSIVGPRRSGRKTLAACVAARLGFQAIGIDSSAASDSDWPHVYLRSQRQALLLNAAIVWSGEGLGRRRPALPGIVPLQFVAADPDTLPPPEAHLLDERVGMPQLSIEERKQLWLRFVSVAQTWPAPELMQLAERFQLELGDIAAIGRRDVSELSEVRELCRLATRDRLGELGQLIDCPFERADLALPEALDARLDDLLFEARERARFWENPAARRLFPRGTGLIALFTGPPGTGKTMAAQIVAKDLGLDLFRVDLATSVSKYIGETAKNLRRLFARAEEMNAVLLFDEADALFTKRTEVRDSHDRYANSDTNYLLQLIENFNGIALLSSNKRENMDGAFVRRLRYVLDFPRPIAHERLRIWRSVVGELAGTSALGELEQTLERFAQVLEMSGAQIKLATLSALFMARRAAQPLSFAHLFQGVTREFANEGRSISPKDRERIERHGR